MNVGKTCLYGFSDEFENVIKCQVCGRIKAIKETPIGIAGWKLMM
jgi:hypothetical protein